MSHGAGAGRGGRRRCLLGFQGGRRRSCRRAAAAPSGRQQRGGHGHRRHRGDRRNQPPGSAQRPLNDRANDCPHPGRTRAVVAAALRPDASNRLPGTGPAPGLAPCPTPAAGSAGERAMVRVSTSLGRGARSPAPAEPWARPGPRAGPARRAGRRSSRELTPPARASATGASGTLMVDVDPTLARWNSVRTRSPSGAPSARIPGSASSADKRVGRRREALRRGAARASGA